MFTVAVSLCTPVDEGAVVGWVAGKAIQRVGSCCCRWISKAFSFEKRADPNKLRHIFDNPRHNLDGLVKDFAGDQAEAYRTIQKADEVQSD